jgi:AcrR family transcriptional regulator
VPTGVPLRDVREQLFDAAERILLRAGPGALTSRALTEEAGCAKGVLHRHFSDFDGFLTEFVTDRLGRIDIQAAALGQAAGTGTVVGNLSDALTTLFASVTPALIGLVITRDELRTRLRLAKPRGLPVAREATAMIASYLTAERELGRITADAEIGELAPTLIGAGHLLFASWEDPPPGAGEIRKAVTTVMASVVPDPALDAKPV